MKLKELIVFAIGFSVSLTSLAQPYLMDLDRAKIYSQESILANLDSSTLKERQLLAILRTIQKVNLPVDIVAIHSGYDSESPGFSHLNFAIKYGVSTFSENPEEGFRSVTLKLYMKNATATCLASVRLYRNEPTKVASALIRYCPQEVWQTLREKGTVDSVNADTPHIIMENFYLKD